MKQKQLYVSLLCALVACVQCSLVFAQEPSRHVDGLRDKSRTFLALTHVHLVTQPGEVVDNATIIIRGSKIEAAGASVTIPAGATIRDAKGMWCYAAFIDPYTNLGLGVNKGPEKPIGFDDDGDSPTTPAVRQARYWNQAVKPQYRAADNLSLDEKSVDEFRRQGIAVVQTNSLDGIFRGSSCVVFVRQGDALDNILVNDAMQWMSFRKGTSKTPYPSSMMGSIALIRQALNDADWYGKAQEAYRGDQNLTRPETNISLEALSEAIAQKKTFVFETENEHSIMRAHAIANEFSLQMVYEGSGYEYRRLSSLSAFHPTLILPVSFPSVPDVSSAERALDVAYDDLLHWDAAPENPMKCDSAGLKFSFTTHQLKNKEDFLKNIRKAIQRGLNPKVALEALTTRPAELLGLASQLGKVSKGYYANLILCDGDIFDEDSRIRSVFVSGDEVVMSNPPEQDLRGAWTVKPESILKSFRLNVEGKMDTPSANAKKDSTNLMASFSANGLRVQFRVNADSLGTNGVVRFSGMMDSVRASGLAVLADGREILWSAQRDSAYVEKPRKGADKKFEKALSLTYPNTAFGFSDIPAQKSVLFKNATVWTCASAGTLTNTDVLISNGKIQAVGKNLGGADITVDATGKHLSPGIIDEHSHIAIEQGVNEGTHAITAEVRIGDVLFPDDINIYRQLSGGVTSSHLLHGSANPIGGQLQLIKLRWGADADGLKFKEAAGTIKFALGENVKQSNWGDRFSVRYPQTRMGVEEIMRDGFRTALEYEQQRKNASSVGMPVRKDLQLETLLEIIHSERFIHCHSYVQSEILMLMRLAEDFNFRVKTFTHILEGYKVAREMKEHGTTASSFADWWAYKYEVYDAIPQNTGILSEQGVVTSVNSDDAEMARRLNQEAAKAIKYGGVTEAEALKMCTINPAIQLGVDKLVGSIEVGKSADIVLWTGNPLSNFSRVLQTYVDGRKFFDTEVDQTLRERDRQNRALLEQRALRAMANGEEKASGPNKPRRREYDCNDIDDEVSGTER